MERNVTPNPRDYDADSLLGRIVLPEAPGGPLTLTAEAGRIRQDTSVDALLGTPPRFVNTTLLLGAFLSAVTNLLFMLLAGAGVDTAFLAMVIAADNLSAGLATTAFVAFLSSLTSISFTAVQYAIFSSVMTLMPKLIGGYSGSLVTAFGYESFFLMTTMMGAPVLVLVWLVRRTMAAMPQREG